MSPNSESNLQEHQPEEYREIGDEEYAPRHARQSFAVPPPVTDSPKPSRPTSAVNKASRPASAASKTSRPATAHSLAAAEDDVRGGSPLPGQVDQPEETDNAEQKQS